MSWNEITAGKRGKPATDIGAFLSRATPEGIALQPKGVASKPSQTLRKVEAYMKANSVKGIRVFIAQETDEKAENFGLYSIVAIKD